MNRSNGILVAVCSVLATMLAPAIGVRAPVVASMLKPEIVPALKLAVYR